ncbi:hypothetical protein BJV74DRAFT_840248 [Russula compacta]|nr:hypothetical protein BJV74DRAFT_840248 [Russula compacta]
MYIRLSVRLSLALVSSVPCLAFAFECILIRTLRLLLIRREKIFPTYLSDSFYVTCTFLYILPPLLPFPPYLPTDTQRRGGEGI